MPTELPNRRTLLAALPAALLMFGPGTSAALAPPDAEVRRTRAQLDTLNQLLAQARQAQGIADRLQWALQDIASRWQNARSARSGSGSDAPLPAALTALSCQTLPGLADVQASWLAAVHQVDSSAGAHLAAVQGVLTVPKARRVAAMARLDDATATRQAAEGAERAAWQALRQAMQQDSRAVDDLAQRWRTLGSALAGTTDGLRQAAPDWTSLHNQWQALAAAAQAAEQAADGAGALLPGLPQPAAPWSAPAAWAPPRPPDGQPLQAWRGSQMRADQAQLARWLQADALAAAQQTLADATCRRTGADVRAACAAWTNDAAALQSGLAARQTALAQARSDQAQAAAAQQAELAAAQPRLQAMLDWQDSLAPAAATAGGPALQALQAAIVTSQATLARLTEAQRQAEEAWMAAWRRQYGSTPPQPDDDSSVYGRMNKPSGAMASMAPQLSSHALHRLRVRNDEPTGFGAYTYVLVGASVRPDTPGVFNRLQRLLGEVRHLPAADELSAEQRVRANTFVVPVPADNRERDALVVDLPLAQSLLTHLPPVLRLADATRRRLYIENGPFLVTLPGRLADARADWPLLFADLSRTPEPVVADVVRRYMADLIGSFNPASTDWKPPAGMQVAITLVRLVKGSGDVAQAVFGGLGR